MFTTYQGAFTVDSTDQIPVVYLARKDINQIALLDTTSVLYPADFLILRSHPITIEGDKRDTRKRSVRLTIFGTGTFVTGTLILCADNMRSESYPITNINTASSLPSQGIILQQGTNALVGRWFDVSIVAIGLNIEISEIKLEAVPID